MCQEDEVIHPGSSVRLHDLKARPELNGEKGTIDSFDSSKGRYLVFHLDHGMLLLKRANLDVINDDATAAAAAKVAELAAQEAEQAEKAAARARAAKAAKEAEAAEAAKIEDGALEALCDVPGCRSCWRHEVSNSKPFDREQLPRGAHVTLTNGFRGTIASARTENRHEVFVGGRSRRLTLKNESLSVRRVTRVVTLLASHVDSAARLSALRHCLRSIVAQTVYAPLHLSWSAASHALAQAVQAVLDELFAPAERALFHRHGERRSQLEHLSFLRRKVAEGARATLAAGASRAGSSGAPSPASAADGATPAAPSPSATAAATTASAGNTATTASAASAGNAATTASAAGHALSRGGAASGDVPLVLTQWALLAPDDDVWHPRRVEAYTAALSCRLGQCTDDDERAFAAACTALTLPWRAVRNAAGSAAGTSSGGEGRALAALPAMATVEEVESLLADGGARLEGTNHEADGGRAPVWSTLVRLDRLSRFCDLVGPRMLASRFCDLALHAFLTEVRGRLIDRTPMSPDGMD